MKIREIKTLSPYSLSLSDWIREEMMALKICTRKRLVDLVIQKSAPFCQWEPEKMSEQIDLLVSQGDLTAGAKGYLACSPLRVVNVGQQTYLLLGTFSNQLLKRELGLSQVDGEILRRAEVENAEDFSQKIEALGGITISLEQWSGMDRVSSAGEEWLDELNLRLDKNIYGDDSIYLWENGKAYLPLKNKKRLGWKKVQKLGDWALVRSLQPGGWFAYGWAKKFQRGKEFAKLLLVSDEARRTVFALNRRAGVAREISLLERENEIHIEIPFSLPYAEYRFLLGVGKRLNWEGFPIVYEIKKGLLDSVQKMLKERLGVEFKKKG